MGGGEVGGGVLIEGWGGWVGEVLMMGWEGMGFFGFFFPSADVFFYMIRNDISLLLTWHSGFHRSTHMPLHSLLNRIIHTICHRDVTSIMANLSFLSLRRSNYSGGSDPGTLDRLMVVVSSCLDT